MAFVAGGASVRLVVLREVLHSTIVLEIHVVVLLLKLVEHVLGSALLHRWAGAIRLRHCPVAAVRGAVRPSETIATHEVVPLRRVQQRLILGAAAASIENYIVSANDSGHSSSPAAHAFALTLTRVHLLGTLIE